MKTRYLFLFFFLITGMLGAQEGPIVVETQKFAVAYKTNPDGKLMQVYIGEKLNDVSEYELLNTRNEAYVPAGMNDVHEPAIRMVHNDDNPSLSLFFKNVEVA